MEAKQELRADGVTVRFGELHALDEVTVTLSAGEIVGLIGPNGSGKSTFINVLSGYVSPVAGHVHHNGVEVTGDAPDARARRGILRTFQAVRLFPRLSVEENLEAAAVATGLRRKAAKERSAEMIELLGLGEIAGSAAGSIPYGAERRVAIARAVSADPQFLLVDEPAAGLDETETDEMAEILVRVCEQSGCGVLVVEHDMRLIAGICHHTIVLSGGAMLATGEPAEVMADQRVIEAYLGTQEVDLDA
jgi:branched-chain amino acid transport system ATP-binding protein